MPHERDAYQRPLRDRGAHGALGRALRASDERTIELLTQIAFQEQEHPVSSGTAPLDQREALQALASRGHDDIVVRGVVRWGLLLPRDLGGYLDGRRLSDAELAPALEALSHDPIPPGAVLALGMSGQPEIEETILALLGRVEPASQQALACLLALEMLSAKTEAAVLAFQRALEVPEQRFVAQRVLDWLAAQQATEENRAQAAKGVWEARGDLWSLYFKGESLETLSYSDNEEMREYLRETALDEASGGWSPSAAIDAVKELEKQERD